MELNLRDGTLGRSTGMLLQLIVLDDQQVEVKLLVVELLIERLSSPKTESHLARGDSPGGRSL
jgi:hypothetical protein